MDKQKIAQVVEAVSSGRYTEKQLLVLYKNAEEIGVTDVLEAIRQRMRVHSPSAATRAFGARDDEARSRLEEVWKTISPLITLQNNKVGNGVKTGGGRIAGDRHIDVYISYKNAKNVGVFLALEQESAESELIAKVGHYATGRNKFKEGKEFPMPEFELAVEEFKRLIIEISAPNTSSAK
jgi:hypothetical protein